MIVITEPFFDFIVNAEGGVMLVFAARPGPAKNPFLVYDRRETMALFRDEGEILRLVKIPRAARAAVEAAGTVDVGELDKDSRPARRYRVRVVLDRNLNKKLKKEASRLY